MADYQRSSDQEELEKEIVRKITLVDGDIRHERWMYEGWNEIPIKKAEQLYEVCKDMPQQLRQRYELMIQEQNPTVKKKIAELEKEIGLKQLIKEFPVFYGDVICSLSTISKKDMKRCFPEWRAVVYREYFASYVIGILFQAYDYDHKQIKEFTFNHGTYDAMGRLKKKGKKVEYIFPKSREVLDQDRPMGHSSGIEFAEAADLRVFSQELEGGVFSRVANIVSILCRPEVTKKISELTEEELDHDVVKYAIKESKGKTVTFIELYDEQTCLDRAKGFDNLTMDVVWEVFFYSVQSFLTSSRATVISLHLQALKLAKQLQVLESSSTVGMEA